MNTLDAMIVLGLVALGFLLNGAAGATAWFVLIVSVYALAHLTAWGIRKAMKWD